MYVSVRFETGFSLKFVLDAASYISSPSLSKFLTSRLIGRLLMSFNC